MEVNDDSHIQLSCDQDWQNHSLSSKLFILEVWIGDQLVAVACSFNWISILVTTYNAPPLFRLPANWEEHSCKVQHCQEMTPSCLPPPPSWAGLNVLWSLDLTYFMNHCNDCSQLCIHCELGVQIFRHCLICWCKHKSFLKPRPLTELSVAFVWILC